MKFKKLWKVFYLNGKELCAYTLEGSFPGEEWATIEQLAFDHDVPVEAIDVKIEKR